MTAKIDLGVTWGCDCGKWNNSERTSCWKCHSPKVPVPARKTRKRKVDVKPKDI